MALENKFTIFHSKRITYTSSYNERFLCVLIKKKYFRTFKVRTHTHTLFEMIWQTERERMRGCLFGFESNKNESIRCLFGWCGQQMCIPSDRNISVCIEFDEASATAIHADHCDHRRVETLKRFPVGWLSPCSSYYSRSAGKVPVLRHNMSGRANVRSRETQQMPIENGQMFHT